MYQTIKLGFKLKYSCSKLLAKYAKSLQIGNFSKQ